MKPMWCRNHFGRHSVLLKPTAFGCNICLTYCTAPFTLTVSITPYSVFIFIIIVTPISSPRTKMVYVYSDSLFDTQIGITMLLVTRICLHSNYYLILFSVRTMINTSSHKLYQIILLIINLYIHAYIHTYIHDFII